MSNEYSSQILNHMFTDDTVRFLQRLNQDDADKMLYNMEKKKAKNIQFILEHDLDTAGAVMTSEFIAISFKKTQQVELIAIKEKEMNVKMVYYIYVMDDNGF